MLPALKLTTVRSSTLLSVFLCVAFCASGCSGAAFVGNVSVQKRLVNRGNSVKVLIQVPNGAVGTYLRIQRWSAGRWRHVAEYNPKQNCPVMQERAGGGYKFVTTRSPMCRQVKGSWLVYWQGTLAHQCRSQLAVLPGRYRVCVARFAKRCQVREGVFGFERPRGASKFICSNHFQIR